MDRIQFIFRWEFQALQMVGVTNTVTQEPIGLYHVYKPYAS
jgi:hypothetical protein